MASKSPRYIPPGKRRPEKKNFKPKLPKLPSEPNKFKPKRDQAIDTIVEAGNSKFRIEENDVVEGVIAAGKRYVVRNIREGFIIWDLKENAEYRTYIRRFMLDDQINVLFFGKYVLIEKDTKDETYYVFYDSKPLCLSNRDETQKKSAEEIVKRKMNVLKVRYVYGFKNEHLFINSDNNKLTILSPEKLIRTNILMFLIPEVIFEEDAFWIFSVVSEIHEPVEYRARRINFSGNMTDEYSFGVKTPIFNVCAFGNYYLFTSSHRIEAKEGKICFVKGKYLREEGDFAYDIDKSKLSYTDLSGSIVERKIPNSKIHLSGKICAVNEKGGGLTIIAGRSEFPFPKYEPNNMVVYRSGSGEIIFSDISFDRDTIFCIISEN